MHSYGRPAPLFSPPPPTRSHELKYRYVKNAHDFDRMHNTTIGIHPAHVHLGAGSELNSPLLHTRFHFHFPLHTDGMCFYVGGTIVYKHNSQVHACHQRLYYLEKTLIISAGHLWLLGDAKTSSRGWAQMVSGFSGRQGEEVHVRL